MRVLVASSRGGPDDFAFTEPGELLRRGAPCVQGVDDADSDCGCGRAFIGLDTGAYTTAGVVAEAATSVLEVAARFVAAIARVHPDDDPASRDAEAMIEAGIMIAEAQQHAVGTVLGWRVDAPDYGFVVGGEVAR